MESPAPVILFIGRPGSGKGTQARLLAERRGWTVLSSGERIKAMHDGDGPISARIRSAYDHGVLVPDWLVDYLFVHGLLETAPGAPLVAEGFGRTVPQAQRLIDALAWLGRPLVALHLQLSDEAAIARMVARGAVEDRPDSDTAEEGRVRLATYAAETEPAIALLRSHCLVHDIDGSPDPETIADAVAAALDASFS